MPEGRIEKGKERKKSITIAMAISIYLQDIDICREYEWKWKTGIDRSYVDWDLIPFHKSFNSSVNLPTQDKLRVIWFLKGNSEGIGALMRVSIELWCNAHLRMQEGKWNLTFFLPPWISSGYLELHGLRKHFYSFNKHALSIYYPQVLRVVLEGIHDDDDHHDDDGDFAHKEPSLFSFVPHSQPWW